MITNPEILDGFVEAVIQLNSKIPVQKTKGWVLKSGHPDVLRSPQVKKPSIAYSPSGKMMYITTGNGYLLCYRLDKPFREEEGMAYVGFVDFMENPTKTELRCPHCNQLLNYED